MPITARQRKGITALKQALILLARDDTDGATRENKVGYNKVDSHRCRWLALQAEKRGLTKDEIWDAYKRLRKYKRQIPEEVYKDIYGE